MKIEKRAIKYVINWERKKGREPADISERKKKYIGFDIISIDKRGDHRLIEVKATTTKDIPDAPENEFTRKLTLVATHLYVVRYNKNNRPELNIIEKKEIDKYSKFHSTTVHVRFASPLITRLRKGDFRVKNRER